MPRLKNTIPKYRKHKASGQAIVEIGGRTHYLGPHGTKASHIEYDRIIAEWLAAGRSSSFGVAKTELAIVELLADYLDYAKRYYGGGPRGEYANMRAAVKELKRLYSRIPVAEFGPAQYKAIRHSLIESGCSRSYVNTQMKRVARVFRWGASEGLVPAEVPQSLSMVPGLKKGRTEAPEAAPILPVSEADVQATLPHLSETISDMARLQRLTGCRPIEVCLIRPCDVDRTAEVWRYVPESHKTQHHGKDRTIFIGPKAQAILRPYLLREAETYLFSPVDSERKRREALTRARKTPLSYGNSVGTNRRREPRRKPRERYDTNSYRRAIHRACDKAEIERWSPNRLRHSAATEVRTKYGLEGSQVILGHSSMNTSEIYAEKNIELAIRISREIG